MPDNKFNKLMKEMARPLRILAIAFVILNIAISIVYGEPVWDSIIMLCILLLFILSDKKEDK